MAAYADGCTHARGVTRHFRFSWKLETRPSPVCEAWFAVLDSDRLLKVGICSSLGGFCFVLFLVTIVLLVMSRKNESFSRLPQTHSFLLGTYALLGMGMNQLVSKGFLVAFTRQDKPVSV